MIKTLKHYQFTILLLAIIMLSYFLLRLPNLTLQPIFADEAIYIRWAQIMRAEPTMRFLPLSDGKTPLFMWVMIPFFKIFEDPLFAGRFLSILSGFATLCGAVFLGFKFFNSRVALWAAMLIAVTPFTLFFDRMALVDSMLAAFSLWALNIALLLVRYQRIDLAMVLGYMLGGGLLTKTPGFFNVLVLPVTLLTFNWKKEGRQGRMVRFFGLLLIASAITFIMYNILRLGPNFLSLSSRNQDYIFSPLDLIGRPLDPFLPHLNDLKDWLPKLLTWPVLILAAGGGLWAVVTREKTVLVIFVWALIPLLIEMALLKTFTARYILFSIPPLLCVAAWFIDILIGKFLRFGKLKVYALSLAVLLPLPLLFNLTLLADPFKASLPAQERHGYFEDWTAGYGFKEIAQFLISEAKNGSVVVGTEGYFGTLPEGLQIYLDKNSHQAPSDKQVIVIGGQASVPAQIRQAAKDHPTYFLANKLRYPVPEKNVQLVREILKAKGENYAQDAIVLFRVFPN